MCTYLNDFLHRYSYPTKAREELMDTYQQLQKTASYSEFQDYLNAYQRDDLSSFDDMIPGLERIAEQNNLQLYSLNLVFLIQLSKHLNEVYTDLQWSEEMYDEAMLDLKYSMIECYRLHRVWGNCKIAWEMDFFRLKRVALGRLQFAIQKFQSVYDRHGKKINPEDNIVRIYVPSSGPLRKYDCEKSFTMAGKFFKKEFKGSKIPFVMSSWLLNPVHKEMLPEDSNIVQFMEMFDIYAVETEAKDEVLWRIFNKDWKENPENLPKTTTLQKAYCDYLASGNQVKIGHGIHFSLT